MPVPESTSVVGRVSTRELIADQIRAWIVQGQLTPGEDVRDVAIAAQLGVSRTPVREAILQLQQEGLIESRPQGWTRVAPLDPRQWAELHPIWVELQVLAARLAAERPDRDLAALVEAQSTFRALIDQLPGRERDLDMTLAITDADDRFHQALIEASGNSMLVATLERLNVLVRRFQTLFEPNGEQVFTDMGLPSVAEHDLLLDALRRRDAAAAAEIVRRNTDKAFPAELREAR